MGEYQWALMGCFLGKRVKGSLQPFCLEERILLFSLCFLTQLHVAYTLQIPEHLGIVGLLKTYCPVTVSYSIQPRLLPVLIHDLHPLYGSLGNALLSSHTVTFDQMVCSPLRKHSAKIQKGSALLIH